MLFYLRIWDYYSGILYGLCIFALLMVSLYVYDCCGNISHHFDEWSKNHRDLAIIGSFLGMLVSTAFIIWEIYKENETHLRYRNSGVYLLEIVLIVLGNFLRRRSILYALLGVLVMNYLVAARHIIHDDPQVVNIAEKTNLPLEYLLYFLMAIDAEKRERDSIKAERYATLFKTCAYLAAYSLLNEVQFPL